MGISYIVTVSSIAILAAVFLVFGEKIDKSKKGKAEFKENKKQLVGFILTLIATLLGVLWAFNLTEYQTIRNEKATLAGLIEQSVSEVNLEIAQLQGYPEFVEDRNIEESLKMLNNNPQMDLVSVNFLISNPSFPKYCTEMGTMAILRLTRDKEKIREAINNQDFELRNRLIYINTYREYLEDIRDALVLEQDHLLGHISSLEVAQGLDALHYWSTHDISVK